MDMTSEWKFATHLDVQSNPVRILQSNINGGGGDYQSMAIDRKGRYVCKTSACLSPSLTTSL